MEIQVNADTTGAELYHLSILFQSLAGARGFKVPEADTLEAIADRHDAWKAGEAHGIATTNHPHFADQTPVVNEAGHVIGTVTLNDPATIKRVTGTDNGVSVGYVVTPVADIDPPATDTNLDVNGLPWDARIHAGSRERNTDGSWRVRRRPKGVEEADWDATLARVTAELADLMAIPVSPGTVADAAAEEAQVLSDTLVAGVYEALDNAPEKIPSSIADPNDHGYQIVQEPINTDHASIDDSGTITVHVAPPFTIAPPVVVPPATAVAPPITVNKPTIETFPQVMVWLTAHTPKDEAAKPGMVTKVNQILTDNGLTVLQQLNQRPELIPQIMAQFIEAFGE